MPHRFRSLFSLLKHSSQHSHRLPWLFAQLCSVALRMLCSVPSDSNGGNEELQIILLGEIKMTRLHTTQAPTQNVPQAQKYSDTRDLTRLSNKFNRTISFTEIHKYIYLQKYISVYISAPRTAQITTRTQPKAAFQFVFVHFQFGH